jgi:hypothetical protein
MKLIRTKILIQDIKLERKLELLNLFSNLFNQKNLIVPINIKDVQTGDICHQLKI